MELISLTSGQGVSPPCSSLHSRTKSGALNIVSHYPSSSKSQRSQAILSLNSHPQLRFPSGLKWNKSFSHQFSKPMFRVSEKPSHVQASADEPPIGVSDSEDTADSLRQQLGALQAEMEEAQRKANGARSRFVRLTTAIEQLKVGAEVAFRAGDEAEARKQLQEKARVMEALQKAQTRADALEALTSKLNQAISRKETQLIHSLSVAKSATSATSGTVHVVPPSASNQTEKSVDGKEGVLQDGVIPGSRDPIPPNGNLTDDSDSSTSEKRSGSLSTSFSEEELKEKFLRMERADLERMWSRSEEMSREAGEGEAEKEEAPADESTSAPMEVVSLPEAELALLKGVDEEIAEVEAKVKAIEDEISFGTGDKNKLARRVERANGVLEELKSVREKIMGKARSSVAGLEAASNGQRKTFYEKNEALSVVDPSFQRACQLQREGDTVGAASSLARWLSSIGDKESPSAAAAAESSIQPLNLNPDELNALYFSYVRQQVRPTTLSNSATSASTSAWGQADMASTASGSSFRADLRFLQKCFHLSEDDLAPDCERLVRTAAIDVALSRVGPSDSVRELAQILGLSAEQIVEVEAEAESTRKFKKHVLAVLRELQGSGTAGVGWRDANWHLKDHHTQEIRASVERLGLEGPSAVAAAASAAREVCRELVDHAVSTAGAASLKVCSLQLETLVVFVRAAALPAMLAACAPATSAAADITNTSAGPGASEDFHTGEASAGIPRLDEGIDGPESRPIGVPDLVKLTGLLRISKLEVRAAEHLYTIFCEERMTAICQKVTQNAIEDDSEVSRFSDLPSLQSASTLSAILGLPTGVESTIRSRSAKKVFTLALRAAMEAGRISPQQSLQLGIQQRALGLDAREAAAIREEVAGQRVGAMCRKLLDKRNSGGDISGADIRNLAFACSSLGATQVANVDQRDRMSLFRRAVQTVLDPTNPSFKWSPAKAVLDGSQMLAILQRVLGLPQSEVDPAIAAVTSVSASAALLQARASFRRDEIEMAADDIGRLAVVLGMHPESVPLSKDSVKGQSSPTEARELFELYGSPFAQWVRREEGNPNSLQERELEEHILERLRKYLGL